MSRETRGLLRFYIYAVISGLQFTWTTWLAYVLAHGGNPGWAESAFHLAIWLGEIPTGIVADLLGRRTSMLVGMALGVVNMFGYFLIHDTLTACLALAFGGLAGTFLSGADTALLYETATKLGGADLARKAMARSYALRSGALAISPFLGGLLYSWHDIAPALARGAVALTGLLVIWGMKEQRPQYTNENRPSIWGQAKAGMNVVMQNSTILRLMFLTWGVSTAASMVGQYGQAYFPYTGLSMVITGAVFSVATLVYTAGNAGSERLSPNAGSQAIRYAPLFIGASIVGMGIGHPWLGAAMYLVHEGLGGLIDPVLTHRFNEAIPDAQRATVLSLQSSGISMLMTMAFPAASYLQPVNRIYLVTGGVAVVLAAAWMLQWRPGASAAVRTETTD